MIASGAERLAGILTALSDDRSQALARLATLVGAVTLARATAGRPLSDEVLAAARQALA